jgi:octaprenyl-diphosphate synthase
VLDLNELHQPMAVVLAGQLEQVTLIFERQLASDLSAVNRLCLHVERYRGKMVRPTLVLLCGLAGAGAPYDGSRLTEKHRIVAAVTEMIHMATLVHDDVLDEADVRRGGSTVNSQWGNETAVMLGDYLISNAFHLCSTADDPSINLALGNITNTLCEGELMQLKTASLIGECCRLGAMLSGADQRVSTALQRYGEALGVAFQLRDDLLDLVGEQLIVGKSVGRDLSLGKLTLPVIHALRTASQPDRGRVLLLLEQRRSEALRELLLETGAVDHAQSSAEQLVAEAKDCLPALLPSPARDLLAHFADEIVRRSY